MKLQENISRIKSIMGVINENNQLNPSILRRLNMVDFDTLIKTNARISFTINKVNKNDLKGLVKSAINNTLYDIMSPATDLFQDTTPNDKLESDYQIIRQLIINYLEKKYTNFLTDYYEKRIEQFHNSQNSNILYKLIKHEKPALDSNGFIEPFRDINILVDNWFFSLDADWDDIITKLNNMEEGTLLISKPNENKFGYYFTIQKIIKK
jgi:hypothetical protein